MREQEESKLAEMQVQTLIQPSMHVFVQQLSRVLGRVCASASTVSCAAEDGRVFNNNPST